MLDAHIDRSIAALNSIRPLAAEAKRAVTLLAECLSNGGKVLMCGNGGSAAEAAHFATELLCRFERDRPSLPALNLSADGSFLTATGNDYDFSRIFSRQVDGLGKKGDLLVAFTTSGNSKNVVRAMDAAKGRGMKVIGFLGRDGGEAKGLADVALVVPGNATAPIQEAHQVLLHYLCAEMEQVMFPGLHRQD
ncbi:MAG: SIS domain-containing protein [Verrucomicrobiales bacterium]|nr:SIS domain-containing protein [Verrucomicrobiales bacterium]